MFKTDLYDEAQSYFSSLNPMTRRILTDIGTTKTIVGEKWNKLSYQDQYDLIMKGFINPILHDKYSPVDYLAHDCFPKRSLCTGDKYVVDDEQGPGKQTRRTTWRDEHSGPFSWETQSQMDLTYIGNDGTKIEEKVNVFNSPAGTKKQLEEGCLKALKEKPPLPKIPPKRLHNAGEITAKNSDNEKELPKPSSRNVARNSQDTKLPPRIKPKQPPPDPPEIKPNLNVKESVGSSSIIQSSISEFDNIPKTGFDFLDNW